MALTRNDASGNSHTEQNNFENATTVSFQDIFKVKFISNCWAQLAFSRLHCYYSKNTIVFLCRTKILKSVSVRSNSMLMHHTSLHLSQVTSTPGISLLLFSVVLLPWTLSIFRKEKHCVTVGHCFILRNVRASGATGQTFPICQARKGARLSGLFRNSNQAHSTLETAKVLTEGGTDVATCAFYCNVPVWPLRAAVLTLPCGMICVQHTETRYVICMIKRAGKQMHSSCLMIRLHHFLHLITYVDK